MPRPLSHADLSDFRARLCQAAEALFAAHGPEAVTMRQLATALGVSAMTPYTYFKDKDAILAAVRAAAFTRFAARLEAAYTGEAEPVAASNAVGAAYVAFAREEPAAYRLMFDLSQPTEDQYPELAAAGRRARATMTAHVKGLIDAGYLQGDPEMIGHIFWAAQHGAIVLEMAGKLPASVDPERLRVGVLAAVVRGLGMGR